MTMEQTIGSELLHGPGWTQKGLLPENCDADDTALHSWGHEEGHLNQHVSLYLGLQLQGHEAGQHRKLGPTQGYKQSWFLKSEEKLKQKYKLGNLGKGLPIYS